MAETVSTKPWSNFSESDYTDEQWLKACLLDRGPDNGSAKQRASLPVREPDGTLNKNACHAAAAALAGARGGVKASPELIASAKKKLVSLYKNALDAEAPESLQHGAEILRTFLLEHNAKEEPLDDFLEHFGVKGMRWGFRQSDPSSGVDWSRQLSATSTSIDTSRVRVCMRMGAPSPKTDADKEALHKAVKTTVAVHTKAMDTAVNSLNSGAANKIFKTQPSSPDRLKLVAKSLNAEMNALNSNYQHNVLFNSRTGDIMVITTPAKLKHAEEFDPNGHAAVSSVKMEYDDAGNFVRASLSDEPPSEMVHSDDSMDNFLEHYGIKGMKWGIRRTDAQLGRIARLRSALSRKKGDDDSSGKSSGGSKKDDDDSDAPKQKSSSEDHEKFVAALGKSPEEMSTRELQEANNRAVALQNYQRMFAPAGAEGKSELQRKVDELNLQKQYKQLQADLTPERKSAVDKLVSTAAGGYNVYTKLDKAVGGDLSKSLSRKLGLEPPPTAVEQAKARAEIAKADKAAADARTAMSKATAASAETARSVQTNNIFRAEEAALKADILRGDLPSRAGGYTGTGKRRAAGDFDSKGRFTPSSGGTRRLVDSVTDAFEPNMRINPDGSATPTMAPARKRATLQDMIDEINRVSSAKSQPGKHRK